MKLSISQKNYQKYKHFKYLNSNNNLNYKKLYD
jgi:hypothetical protein